MDRASVTQRFKEIVADELHVEAAEVTDVKTFKALGADSLGITDIIMRAEEEFSIPIPDEESEKLDTVGKTITYIQAKTKLP
jgi:acyl carrier protein